MAGTNGTLNKKVLNSR